MALFREHADVSVRPATAQDEALIARTQLRAWRASHTGLLGADVLEHLDVTAVRAQWSRAISAPPSREHHVLVACDGARVVGFAACAPVVSAPRPADGAPDASRGGSPGAALDGSTTPGSGTATSGSVVEVLALEVDPDHQRGGHGSRLLAACVDLAREGGAAGVQTWVLADDGPREQFLASAGLGPDGVVRELGLAPSDDGGTRAVTESRWVAEI